MINHLKSLNVLLVEDEKVIQKNLKEMLEHFFYKVYTADDGLMALDVLKSHLIHSVFTDYEMPHLDGYQLIKQIRSFNQKLPIVIISNHDDREKLQSCIPLGLSGYIFKPIRYDDFKMFLANFEEDLLKKSILEFRLSLDHKINFTSNTLTYNETTYQLTRLESCFLQMLISLDGKVATFEHIFEILYEFELSQVSIKNLIYRLKNKYHLSSIKNIKDVGYILVDN